MQCGVCGCSEARYRCPNCSEKYCGVACYNIHKSGCRTVSREPPRQALREEVPGVLTEENLRALSTDSHIRNCLKSAELQKVLFAVDSSRSRLDALESFQYNIPDFGTFCDHVLETISKSCPRRYLARDVAYAHFIKSVKSPLPLSLKQSSPKMSDHGKEELPPSENGSFANSFNGSFSNNVSFATRAMIENLNKGVGEDDWNALEKDIRRQVSSSPGRQEPSPVPISSDIKYFDYPSFPAEAAAARVVAPEDPTLVKVFMGNMRFEMGRQTIAWAVKKAANIEVLPSNVLVHFKQTSAGHHTPTGCASVYLKPDEAPQLLDFNQRIFCGARGIFIAMTSEGMRALVQGRRVLDIGPDGKVRGPKHAMVIETSRPVPQAPSNSSFASSSSFSTRSFAVAAVGPATQEDAPPYVVFPGETTLASAEAPSVLNNPVEFFIGGICYEATPQFVQWMISLTGVGVHLDHITMFADSKTGNRTGCAMVKVDAADFETVRAFHRRFLCDSKGVFIADDEQGIPRFLKNQRARGEPLRGPTHAVVIERRRSHATPPPAYSAADLASTTPPPPPYFANWSFPIPVQLSATKVSRTPPAPSYLSQKNT